jgi:hypothetical protein
MCFLFPFPYPYQSFPHSRIPFSPLLCIVISSPVHLTLGHPLLDVVAHSLTLIQVFIVVSLFLLFDVPLSGPL